jgi:uncharacterized membrane protein
MELLLIIVLGIALLVIWNRSRDAISRVREAVDRLEREVDLLRSQLASLVRASNKPGGKKAAESVSKAEQGPTPAEPAAPRTEPVQAARAVPPAVAAFAPAAPLSSIEWTPAQLATRLQATSVSSIARPEAPDAVPETQSATREIRPRPPEPEPPSIAAETFRAPQPAMPATARPAFTFGDASSTGEPARAAATRLFSLEEALGANWLNKIGIASVVIGLAFFLAYKLQTWGPGGKVMCGFSVSIALLGGGVLLERKPTYRIFARGGIGGGWALAYFTTFAMYHLQAARILDSLAVDLMLMLMIAAGMVGHSLRYRSQTVTSLAFLLGFATLLTSHIEEPSQTVVFSLAASAILAIALVVVTTIRHWAVLELCGLIAVYVSHFVWLSKVLPENHPDFAEFWPSTALILLYWVIFRLAYVMRTPLDKREENLSSVSAIVNSGGVLGLLKFQSAHPEWAFWALIVLGVLEMGLAYWAKSRRRQAFVVLSTIAVVLLVSSVPFRFHGVSWPVLWLVQAQVLAIAGLRLDEPVFRRLGLLTGLITGSVLALRDVMPLAVERLVAPEAERHWSLVAGLALAAILYWTHSEVYPRRWPGIEANALEKLALRVSSWLALGTAATCLWVVLPNDWLPLGWLALFLLLVAAGQWFGASMPPLEGDLLALATVGLLVFRDVLPLVFERAQGAEFGKHPVQTTVLSLAALAFWARGELLPRALPKLPATPNWDPAAWDAVMLPLASCIGTASAAAALWVSLPSRWVAVGWLVLMLVLGLTADWIESGALALAADALTVTSILWLNGWNVWKADWAHRTPLLIAVLLLYCGMRRKRAAGARNYVPAAYSWAAAVFLPFLAFDIFKEPWVAPVLVSMALALFEIGRLVRKGFLRWQGYALIAVAFTTYISGDLPYSITGLAASSTAVSFSLVSSRLLEILILLAGGYWLLERTRGTEHVTKVERGVGLLADAFGTFCVMVWIGVRFPFYVQGGEGWIAAIWAAMATMLMALAWLMRRRTFLVQAIAIAVAVVLRGMLFDLIGETSGNFWHGTLSRLSVAALVLVAALPFAFRLRGAEFWADSSMKPVEPLGSALRHPEQWFFFLPFGLMVLALALKLSSGHITIAWSLLGLGTFLLALVVGERSYRLAGLALLLVSVAKIVLMDVWKLAPPDRYSTLIVLGLALLAVSFLYTRFSTTIRKYL